MKKLLLCTLIFLGCASRLPRTSEDRPSREVPDQIPLASVELYNVDTGAPVSLDTYFQTSDKDWLVLLFGSKGCTSCAEKMQESKDWALKHSLWETPKGRRGELVGVYCNALDMRGQIQRYKAAQGYDHLKFMDDTGSMLRRWFLPPEMPTFGVPVTVFVQRNPARVLWTFPNTVHYGMREVMAKVQETLNTSIPDPPQPPVPPDPPVPPVPPDPPVPPVFDEPSFNFVTSGDPLEFKTWWPRAEFSVVTVLGELCSGCWDELGEWSKPGRLVDQCVESGRCQLLAVENGVPEEEDQALRVKRMEKLFVDRGVRFPVVLDPLPSDGDGWKTRYFDGYLTDKFPGWEWQFGTVIYSKTGKILFNEKAGDPGGVEAGLKGLMQ